MAAPTPVQIAFAELVLGAGHALLGGAVIPGQRALGVDRHAAALAAHVAEVLLGRGVALLGGAPEPARGLEVAALDAAPVVIHGAEVVLGKGQSLPAARRSQRTARGVVALDAIALLVHQAEVELGVGIAAFGGLAEPQIGLVALVLAASGGSCSSPCRIDVCRVRLAAAHVKRPICINKILTRATHCGFDRAQSCRRAPKKKPAGRERGGFERARLRARRLRTARAVRPSAYTSIASRARHQTISAPDGRSRITDSTSPAA